MAIRSSRRRTTTVAWLANRPISSGSTRSSASSQSGRVVDLGCGSGVPITRYFAARGYQVEGYDLSPAMLDVARREVPAASFTEARIEDVDLEPNSVDLIVSFFAIIHVPREEHAALFGRMRTWLRPGGMALLSLGTSDNPSGFEPDWHGAPMAWSHFDADTSIKLLREAGFDIDWSEIEEFGAGRTSLIRDCLGGRAS